MKTRPQCRVLRVWGVPAPFPLPSTTQTQRTRPYGRVIRFWDVADTLNMKTRPGCPYTVPCTLYCPDTKNTTMWSHSSRLGYSPNIPLTQTRRTRPSCCILHVWPTIALLWIQKHDPLGHVFPVHSFLINIFNVLDSKIKIMSFLKKNNLRF